MNKKLILSILFLTTTQIVNAGERDVLNLSTMKANSERNYTYQGNWRADSSGDSCVLGIHGINEKSKDVAQGNVTSLNRKVPALRGTFVKTSNPFQWKLLSSAGNPTKEFEVVLRLKNIQTAYGYRTLPSVMEINQKDLNSGRIAKVTGCEFHEEHAGTAE